MRNSAVSGMVLFLLAFSIKGKAQDPDFYYLKDYPSYREIVHHFLGNYETEEYKTAWFSNFRFARNPEGWTVYPMVFHGDSLISKDTISLWTRAEGYLRRAFNSNPEPMDSAVLLSNEKLYEYSIHPFYAYEGWPSDVIGYYRDKDEKYMTKHELYGIGRAYSQAASDILWPHARWSVRLSGKTILKKKDLRQFVEYSEEAVGHFMRLRDRDPHYHTIVGNIDVKLHNEIMAKWYEMKIFGYDRFARRFLRKYRRKENIYHEFWREYARHTLREVPAHSVLLTHGDNDTYPLLYQQFVEGYGRDVLLVNTSLLADPVYFRSLLNKNLYDENINSSITPEEYEDLSRTYIYVSGELKEALPFSIIREEVLNAPYSNKEISIDAKNFYSSFANKDGTLDTLLMKTVYDNYILPAQFLVMSLVDNNIEQKNFYLTNASAQNILNLFYEDELTRNLFTTEVRKDYMRDEGFKMAGYLSGTISKPSLPYPGSNSTAQKRIFANMMISEAFTIAGLKSNDTLSLEDMTHSFFEKYPPEKCGINLSYVLLLHLLYQEGLEEEAGKYLPVVIDLMKEIVENTPVEDDELYDESILSGLEELAGLLMQHSEKMDEGQVAALKEISGSVSAKLPVRININRR